MIGAVAVALRDSARGIAMPPPGSPAAPKRLPPAVVLKAPPLLPTLTAPPPLPPLAPVAEFPAPDPPPPRMPPRGLASEASPLGVE
eukprot:scaffold11777_cov99-Isochrysis_galbana.AAC.4